MLCAAEIPAQRDVFTFVIAIIGATTGLIGAILGVLNSVMAWRDRPHLKVVPKLYLLDQTNPRRFILIDRQHEEFVKYRGLTTEKLKLAIEVINCSSSKPVSVSYVGFARRFAIRRYLIWDETGIKAVHPDGPTFGRRLEPLTRFIIYTNYTPRMVFDQYGRFTFALAETESGKTFRGSSRILRHVRKKLLKPSA